MARVLLIFMLAASFGCNQGDGPPSNMLSEEQMVKVLVDLHLAEARTELLYLPQDSIRPLLETRYTEIFAEHNIDTAAFNQSFAYYERNPERMDSLYQKVIDDLVEREATYRANAPDSAIAPLPVDSATREIY
ncbi:hypothetical protein BH09BAC1_BH09BAC1_24710 [soil metagenome]